MKHSRNFSRTLAKPEGKKKLDVEQRHAELRFVMEYTVSVPVP
jgi:hypothetical protein